MRKLFQFTRRSRGDIRHDVDEELAFHIESRSNELKLQGLDDAAANAQALREFGDIDDARTYLRTIDHDIEHQRRRKDYMSEFAQDLKYAWRSMLKAPLFTVVAVLTLALGIGANTAIFSVVHGVLQRPLPYPEPDQLVRAWAANPSTNRTEVPISVLDLDDWRAQAKQFVDLAGFYYSEGQSGVDFTGQGTPQRLSTAFITPGFFKTMGVAAAVGRVAEDREMVRGGDDKVAVLSYAFWQRQFGGTIAIVGTTIQLNGEAYRVLGVMPQSFMFPASSAEIFIPYSSIPDTSIPHIRPVRVLEVVARIKPGVSQAAANADLNAIAARLGDIYPEDAPYKQTSLVPLRESMTGSVKAPLLVLLAAVSFVLLMACVNVASLQLARASVREREMAVRASLGASRGRIARQLITENLALAFAGGAIGFGLAQLGTRVLLRVSAGQLPLSERVGVDATVLVFAAAVTVVAGLLFGLAPAVRASAKNLQGMLRSNSGGTIASGLRIRNVLVVTQVAFAVVLAVGAGLMTRSFSQLLRVETGFRPDHLLAFNFTINTDLHGSGGAWKEYYRQVVDRARAIPGVVDAGAAQFAPFRGMGERNSFALPGEVRAENEEPRSVPTQRISDGYFRVIGARMIAGREFTPADRDSAPLVVVVNEAFAKKYLPGATPVGQRLMLGATASAEVVGVVSDVRQSAMNEPAPPLMYLSNMQNGRVKVTLVLRTKGDPLALTKSVQSALLELDRDQPITSIFTFDDVVSEAVARPRLLAALFTSFGVVGLLLGAIGIYGVLAFLVNQRRREIGLRMALGASNASVLRLVLNHGLVLASVGVVVGVGSALLLARYMQSLLYGIAATDPQTYVGVALVLVVIAMVASLLPARRAASLDPMIALQHD